MTDRALSDNTFPQCVIQIADLETKEHIGGFWILDAANMDEAVAWGRQAVVACRASVEVREFLATPTE